MPYQSLMLPALKALYGSAETPISDVRASVAVAEGLTPEDVRELLPNSPQSVFTNRISWAVIYMTRAGLVERVRRGIYRLTAEGERLLDQTPPRIDNKLLGNYPAYAEWRTRKRTPLTVGDSVSATPDDVADTPEEVLNAASLQLREALEADVLERVQEADSAFLERVVVDLLIAMGYGGGGDAMAGSTALSGKMRSVWMRSTYRPRNTPLATPWAKATCATLPAHSTRRAQARACLSPPPASQTPPRTMWCEVRSALS